jgi:hypothetical protein
MASKFDYSINIPQPTGFGAGMMQKIGALQNIVEAQDRSALMQQLAPLQVQQAQANLASTQQQMSQSAAAAARAAESFQLNKQAALAAQERERNMANQIAEYGLDPEKDLSSLAPIFPMMDKNRIDALRKVETMKIANAFQKIDPESPDPEAIRKLSARSLILDTDEGKRFDGLLASLPNPAKEKLIDTALQVSNAGMAGNNDVAKKRLEEVATAYSDSKDARFQQLGKLMTQTLESVPENATPSYWALLGQTLMFRTGDDKAIGKFNEILTNYSKETSPEAVAEKKASTLVKEADARLKSIEADFKESGALEPEKKASREMQMKQAFESEPLVKAHMLRKDFVTAVQLSKELNSIPGDASAIVAAVKINDPTSTVSVTEGNLITGGTVPAAFRAFVAKINDGGKLSEKDRDDLIRLAERRIKDSENQYNTYLKNNIAIAKRYGLDPENIFVLPDAPTQSVLGKKAPQTRQEQLRGKSVPPPVPTGGTTLSIDDLLKKYGQ